MTVPGADRVLGGRYRLIREIARGGMAVIWQAEDNLLERQVAVKVLHPQFAADAEFLERFRREARAAARLSHPNIVQIHDVGEDAETRTPYIVMEFVPGGNLKDRIRSAAPRPEAEIRSIGATLAETLDYAHRKGLIHRDVKPQNVLIADDRRPMLTDFGIAQAVASSGLTRTGVVMGSVHYIAPELVRGRAAVPQSDIYSLGVVLYEMATGRVPFEAATDLAVALAHLEETPAPPRALNARLAPDLERTILRSLAKAPEQRFLSAEDMATALREGSNGAVTEPMPTQPVSRTAPRQRRRATPQAVAPAAPFARRATRPAQRRGSSTGLLGLLLALAAVLFALGAGFYGLASLSREGVATPAPTAPPKPAAVPTRTTQPATATPLPSATPLPPTPTPVPPSPSPVPPSPTPPPQPTATPRSIVVPQLRGKTLDDAQAALKSAGLTTTVKGVNANADKNVVVDESPDAGASLAPGGTIMLTVGTGSTVVPDVANTPRDQAAKTLSNNSFRVNIRDKRDNRVPAGTAIGTNPAAGTVLPRGADVELQISSGRG